ncbi:hypothetical protein AB0X79_09755, partial [Pediococcus pentosaceus]|uniref:hypothetical protein n=1 Tax=Pediococcus pentosaceus TaxID=1255 RepID=UPI003F22F62C
NQGINGNNSLRYLEFREGAFDFQTSRQNLPVLLGRGTKDDSVPKSSFEKWSSIIMADSLVKEYEGDHFFIYDSDNSFINDLNDFLEKVGY